MKTSHDPESHGEFFHIFERKSFFEEVFKKGIPNEPSPGTPIII